MKKMSGIGASEGVSIGKALLFIEEEIVIPQEKISGDMVGSQLIKLEEGLKKSKTQLIAIREKVKEKMGEDKAAIFDGHIMLLEDEDLKMEVEDKIKGENSPAAKALDEGINEYCEMISQLDDPYLRERAADLKDVGKRWIKNVLGMKMKDLSNLEKDTIVVTYDLTPSDTAQLDLENCIGFITEVGGKTSHSAIMARSLELPAIVGVKDVLAEIFEGQPLIMDGEKGDIIVEPIQDDVATYSAKRAQFLADKEELKKLINEDAITLDGRVVEIYGNIGGPNDVDAVVTSGATGVGLYRTEFLFMNSDHMPTEDEQYQAYRIVAEKMKGKPVTIRTMDIGGDKELPYMNLPKEMNPFLGYRAIRISLEQQDMFKTQLRAILRASSYGQIKIMYPMITSVNEIRKANEILAECKEELDEIGKKYDEKIKVGIMIETPSTAIIAYKFAKEVDFFSIGTNDLTQYFLAVDRGNEMVSNLYSSFNPAVLEAIQKVIDAAHDRGIPVSMCGEFAGDKKATELLLGMGLDIFSMSASSVLQVKKKIRTTDYQEARKYRDLILEQDTPQEVLDNLRSY
ncbi:MAG: phosphoenolpyruvate--protein phosphotransferase [Leptotrichiaceae bacterium]|jgi:phosphotransferase system enzyme I (PtsI)|nr:phosphoenolpyruvate--protein phosphotransferase [Leptotrichiaceae bacterium]MBP6167771.1 phosphoenolpyruvate--protein phosphotransferase [Leptotrichiaceae bacterium]MBP7025706.1 phosphoenolpyruvate--protein phosphotransferase [Leptotrichiaceae bacterium]MBP8636463.1 phosphoenolpyruvate--protein phosphotransferase [Leptotrichiaceae bacterium]MBP9538318.1 phosphoenolpyruvate--protein phosphotransferase [Leptotrichiaceae bacterium]